MFLRVLLLTILLFGMVLSNFLMHNSIRLTTIFSQVILGIMVFMYFLSIFYGLILKYIRRYLLFFYAQIFVDLLAVSFTVHATGGSGSGYTALFLIAIVGTSIIDKERGALISGAISSILFLSVSILGYYRFLPLLPGQFFLPWDELEIVFLKNLGLNFAAFWAVAFMSAHLGTLLGKADRESAAHKTALDNLSVHHNMILRFINSGIISTDTEDRILSINTAAEKILDCRKEDVLNESCWKILPILKDDMARTSIDNKTGNQVILDISRTSYSDKNGKKQGDIYLITDRTNLERMEKEVRKNEHLAMLGRFAAGIAHEIRNPLASMSGAIELLKQATFPEESEDGKLMNILFREVERLDLLITDLLVFARPRPIESSSLVLKDLLSDIIRILDKKGKDLEIVFEPQDEGSIRGDEDKLKQVFLNLFVNAVDGIKNKGIIEVDIDKKGEWLIVSIKDNGMGIAEKDLAHIFEPFFTTKKQGTGLGLAIVHQIVSDHGGKTEVHSEKNKGTLIKVFLPYC